MTEIKSGSEFTASRVLLEKMREFASNGKNADGSVDLSKNQITKDEIDQLKSLAGADTAGLTEDERKLIDGLDSSSQNDTATVEHNIAELNKDLKAANQVDFESMKLRTQSTSFFGLFRSTSENTVKLSDSHIPSVQNPNTNVTMQERSTLEQENLKQMMEPFENALNAQPPSQEIMERMALMVEPPLNLESSPNMSEEQSKRMREAAQQRIEQLKTDPELQKATLAKVAEMKEKIAAYKQNPTEAFRPMYEAYCQLATGYAVLPPAENSLFSKGYIAALNGANYNVFETNKQALDHKAAIQNGDFITPPSIEQINQTQQGTNQAARDKIVPMLNDANDLVSKLEALQKEDPEVYKQLMQGFGTEDLDVLKVRLHDLKQYMDAQPPNPITQAQMSQMSYIEGSLIRLQYQTKIESLNTQIEAASNTADDPAKAAYREQLQKDLSASQLILDDPNSSAEDKSNAQANIAMCTGMLAELNKQTNVPLPKQNLQDLSSAFQKLYGPPESQSFLKARDEVRSTVSKQSQTIAELEHVEQSINQLMTRTDLSLENRKSLESKLAAIQQAKSALMQGQPVDIKDPLQKEAFEKVLGMLSQVRSSNQSPLLAPAEGYGNLFTDANTDQQAFGFDAMCYFDLDYDFSTPFSMDDLFGGSSQKVQDLLLDDLKTRQSNLGTSESVEASHSIPTTVTAENRQLYQSLLTVRNSPGVDDKTKACINVALEQLSDPDLKADGPEMQTIKQVAATYDQLKRDYGSNAANLAFINAVQNLFPGDKTPSSLEVKQLLLRPDFSQKLQSAIDGFINDDKFIEQSQKLKTLSAEEYQYDNLTDLLNRSVPGQSHPLEYIVQKLKDENVPWNDSLSMAENIQKLSPETRNKYFKDPQVLQDLTRLFEGEKTQMAELEKRSQSLSNPLSPDERDKLISYQQTALQIAQLKALDKFEETSQTVIKQREAQIPVLNSTISNLTSQLSELRARRPPVDPRILGPIEAQLKLLTDAKAKLDAGGTLNRDDIGNIAIASALSEANTQILKFVQLNPDNPAVQALYDQYIGLLTRRHQFSGQDLTELLGRFESVPGVVRPTDQGGGVSSFNFEEEADKVNDELGGNAAPPGPSGTFEPTNTGNGGESGGVDFSQIKLPPDSGPLADLVKSIGEQNKHINSLSGEERRKALEDAIEVGEIMNRAFTNFSQGKIESDEEFGRHIKEQNAFNKAQLEAVLSSKQTSLIQKADQDESDLNLAPMPEVSGDEHFSQWLAETLNIIRNWDEKERQAFMAALALKMMDEVIRSFYKDQQDRSTEHHEASINASKEHSQQLVRSSQESRDFGSVGNDQAVAAMSGQGRASDRSEAFNRAAQIDPQTARQELIGMIQSARTGDQRLHISAADEEALLAKFDTLMLAVSTPDTEDDRLAVMAMA